MICLIDQIIWQIQKRKKRQYSIFYFWLNYY